MIAVTRTGTTGLGVSWSTVEFAGCAAALFVYSGALFPLLMSSPEGTLDAGARSILRATQLPAYAVALVLIVPHLESVVRVVRRNLPFTVLVLLPFASIAWSAGPSISLRRAIAFLFSMVLAYLLAARFTPRRLLLLVATVLGITMVGSLLLYVVMPGLGRMPGAGEVRGIFLHKNVLGWYSAAATIVFVVLATDRVRRVALVGRAMAAVSLACLLLSASATGLFVVMSAAALSVFYIAFARSRGLSRVLLLLLFAQAVVGFLLVAVPLSVYVLEAIGKDATLTGRIPLWAEVDPFIAQRWLLGYGFQAFWDEGNTNAWQIWALLGWQAPHSHNGTRDILLSLGVVGFGLFAIIVMRALMQGAWLLAAPDGGRWLWLNLYAAVFIAMNLTESLYLEPNDLLFILFAAALLIFSDNAATLSATRARRVRSAAMRAIAYD